MLPYCLLQFGPPAMGRLLSWSDQRKRDRITVAAFFLFFLALLFFRKETVGTDLAAYQYYMELYAAMSPGELLSDMITSARNQGVEPGWAVLNWLLGRLPCGFRLLMILVAIFSLMPTAMLYLREVRHPYLTCVLFLNIGMFPVYFSALRQVVAVSFGVLAYQAAREKKLRRFLLLVLGGYLFHRSALVCLLLYPLCHIRIRRRHMWYIAPAMALLFVCNRPLIQLVMRFTSYKPIYNEISSTGAYGMLVLYVLFCAFSFVVVEEEGLDDETCVLRNILLLVTVIQIFAPVSAIVMRVNYYFLPFIPLLLPRIIDRPCEAMQHVARWALAVLTVFFSFYFLWDLRTGADILEVYPYLFLWQGA